MNPIVRSIVSGLKALAIGAIAQAVAMQSTGLDPLGKDWKTLLIGALAAAFLKGGEKAVSIRRNRDV